MTILPTGRTAGVLAVMAHERKKKTNWIKVKKDKSLKFSLWNSYLCGRRSKI